MKILRITLLITLFSFNAAFAIDEVSYTLGDQTMEIPGVIVNGSQYYDVVMALTDPNTLEFTLTSVLPVLQPGAVIFDSSTRKLIIPSLRYNDSSGVHRYKVEFTMDTLNPMRLKPTKAIINNIVYQDSSDASKVAAWLRATAPADNDVSHFAVIGLQNFNGLGNKADSVLSTQGVSAFYQNSQAMQEAQNVITSRISSSGPIMQAGGITSFRDVQNLPWGMVEPTKGKYNFTLMDILAQQYQLYGIDYIAVAMPFADWDLSGLPAADSICQHFFTEDYKYLAYAGKMGRYVDINSFINMLKSTVERYDGDGVNDMPGLLRSIKYWQLHNEPEGENCGQFRDDESSFVEFMSRGYKAIKEACPDCQVINGGAGLLAPDKKGGNFWWDYADLGGNSFIDIIALHYNEGKHRGEEDVSEFETMIGNIKDALGSDKPIWLTEFGVAVNLPPGGNFVSMSETQAAAWFTRFYAAGLNGGVTRFFSDSVAFFFPSQNSISIRLPYYTNKLIEAKIGNFTESSKLASGQYRFKVNKNYVYVLWSGIPAELTGEVTSYDIYGNETKSNATKLNPTQNLPLIVVK